MVTTTNTSANTLSAAQRAAPPLKSVAVVAHDTNELAPGCIGIYVGVAGDISMKLANDDTAVVFKSVPVGFHRVCPKLIRATGTTATDMVALY